MDGSSLLQGPLQFGSARSGCSETRLLRPLLGCCEFRISWRYEASWKSRRSCVVHLHNTFVTCSGQTALDASLPSLSAAYPYAPFTNFTYGYIGPRDSATRCGDLRMRLTECTGRQHASTSALWPQSCSSVALRDRKHCNIWKLNQDNKTKNIIKAQHTHTQNKQTRNQPAKPSTWRPNLTRASMND